MVAAAGAAPTRGWHADRHRHRRLPRPRARALPGPRRARLAARDRRPRARGRSRPPPRELPDGRHPPRRRRRSEPPARARRGRGRPHRPARQQRLAARAEPAAGARRLPARRARARLPRQRPRAARADPARAAALAATRGSSTSPPTPPSSPTRAGAATAPRRPRSSSSPRSSPPSTRTRRIYAVDPGDMNTRMHQEAFPGEDISDRAGARGERARPAGADRGRPAERALRRRRAAGVARVSALAFTLTPAARGARAAAPSATRSGCWSRARRRRARARHASAACPATCAPGDLLVVNTSATMPAALPATRADGRVDVHLSTPLPALEPRGARSRWVVELRRARRPLPRRGRAGERLALPGGGSAELLAPYSRPAALWVAALDLPAPLHDYLAEHGRPIAYGHHVRAARPLARPTRRSSPTSRAAPRCRAPAARSRSGCSTTCSPRGVQVAPLVLHTGVVLARARRAPVPGALPRPRADRQPRQRPPRRGRARDRGRHDGRARARDRRRPGRPRRARRRAGPA